MGWEGGGAYLDTASAVAFLNGVLSGGREGEREGGYGAREWIQGLRVWGLLWSLCWHMCPPRGERGEREEGRGGRERWFAYMVPFSRYRSSVLTCGGGRNRPDQTYRGGRASVSELKKAKDAPFIQAFVTPHMDATVTPFSDASHSATTTLLQAQIPKRPLYGQFKY
jgi:hypothetical protein